MTDDEDALSWSGPFLVVRDIDGVRHAIRHTWIAGIREVSAGDDVTLIVTKFGTVTVPRSFEDVIEMMRWQIPVKQCLGAVPTGRQP